MIRFIIFAALAWFAITVMKDLIRISEQRAIEKAKKKAQDAQELARAEADAARAEARAMAKAEKAAKAAAAAAAAEEMVSCAICGTLTPKNEAIATQGQYYCSEAHFLQRTKPEQIVEAPAVEEAAEETPEATPENA
jgi:late competence protein required for DNA uptake (superfamily II DNA/RNA helicase)